jgi:hypothetical protein
VKSWPKKLLLILVALVAGSAAAFSQGQEQFAGALRTSLDRLFYPEQYVLDVQVSGDAGPATTGLPGLSGGGSEGLPGLNFGADNQAYNVLIVLDSSISSERVRIAREVVTRQIESRGMTNRVTLNLKQDKVLKVLPDELQSTTRQIVSGSNGASGSPANGSAPVAAPTPSEQAKTSIYDFIENKRELAVRALVVLWTALASLIALYIVVQRLFGSRSIRETRGGQGAGGGPTILSSNPSAPVAPGGAGSNGKSGMTKEEIYSKDQALFQHIQDVVEQARQEPGKVAKVMERWVQTGADNVRYAAIFMKNCDIKTIENVSKHLHPTDIQRIVETDVEDFDPFSDENRRVLDEVRAQIALMAASHAVKERPDVFDFLKSISDEDLLSVLSGESIDDIALIATQIPVHRMTVYISGLDPEAMQALMNKISELHSPSLDDIAPLRKRLEKKTGSIGEVLVTKASRVQTLTQMISNVSLPDRQEEAAENLKAQYPDIYQLVRKGIILVSDLEFLPARAQKVFLQQVDGEILGTAFSTIGRSMTNLLENMPPAVRVVYVDYVGRTHDQDSVSKSWKKIQDELRDLVSSGLISNQEVQSAKTQADENRRPDEDQAGIGEVSIHGAA